MTQGVKVLLICGGIIWGVCNVIVVVILSRVTETLDDPPIECGEKGAPK